MKRHELSDQQWQHLAPFFPPRPRQRGGPWQDDRTIRNGMFGRLNTGAPWRDLPERSGKWQTVPDRFAKLRQRSLFNRIREALQRRRDQKGLIDFDLGCVDGSSIRASRAAAGASKKSNGHSVSVHFLKK
jgi:transposase